MYLLLLYLPICVLTRKIMIIHFCMRELVEKLLIIFFVGNREKLRYKNLFDKEEKSHIVTLWDDEILLNSGIAPYFVYSKDKNKKSYSYKNKLQ